MGGLLFLGRVVMEVCGVIVVLKVPSLNTALCDSLQFGTQRHESFGCDGVL